MNRRAKIVCTLGPASRTSERIGQLIDEGMDVARLNFSHGDHAMHAETLGRVRAEADRRGRPVAVLQDLQGPKIRVGRFAGGAAELEVGADFTLSTEEFTGDQNRASTTYQELPHDVILTQWCARPVRNTSELDQQADSVRRDHTQLAAARTVRGGYDDRRRPTDTYFFALVGSSAGLT